jgi:hypothetical protein
MIRLSRSTQLARVPATSVAAARSTKRNGRRGVLVGVGVVALMAVLFNAFVSWLGKENWTMLPI